MQIAKCKVIVANKCSSTCKLQFLSARCAWCLLILSLVGCGEASTTVPVAGHVAYRNQAIAKGIVTFFPPAGRPIIAPLSTEGDYRLHLEPGDYTVTVDVGVEVPPGYREGALLPPPKVVLPDEYTVRIKSTLKTTVKEGQDRPIDFELK